MINMCAKFNFNYIYLKNSMEGGPFRSPLALERQKKPSINRINVGKCRLVKVIFSNIHKNEKCFYFLLHSSLSVKMLFLGKLKLIYPSTPKRYNNCSAPTLIILVKKFLAPSPFKREGRDYAFYMREYKVETIKLLPFYMTHFLFTEQLSHNI